MSEPSSADAPDPTMQPPERAQRSRRQYPETGIDKFETIMAIVLGPFGCALGSSLGVIAAPRPPYGSDHLAFSVGIVVMVLGPWICWLASSVWAVVRLVRRKRGAVVMTGGLVTAIVLYVATYLVLAAVFL